MFNEGDTVQAMGPNGMIYGIVVGPNADAIVWDVGSVLPLASFYVEHYSVKIAA